jgi:hypothetical protein
MRIFMYLFHVLVLVVFSCQYQCSVLSARCPAAPSIITPPGKVGCFEIISIRRSHMLYILCLVSRSESLYENLFEEDRNKVHTNPVNKLYNAVL